MRLSGLYLIPLFLLFISACSVSKGEYFLLTPPPAQIGGFKCIEIASSSEVATDDEMRMLEGQVVMFLRGTDKFQRVTSAGEQSAPCRLRLNLSIIEINRVAEVATYFVSPIYTGRAMVKVKGEIVNTESGERITAFQARGLHKRGTSRAMTEVAKQILFFVEDHL